jgi:hypothetical protein
LEELQVIFALRGVPFMGKGTDGMFFNIIELQVIERGVVSGKREGTSFIVTTYM